MIAERSAQEPHDNGGGVPNPGSDEASRHRLHCPVWITRAEGYMCIPGLLLDFRRLPVSTPTTTTRAQEVPVAIDRWHPRHWNMSEPCLPRTRPPAGARNPTHRGRDSAVTMRAAPACKAKCLQREIDRRTPQGTGGG